MPAFKKTSPKTGRVSWFASFYYTDWTGQRKQKKKEGFNTQREAKEYERRFLDRLAGSPEMTFDALADRYMDDLKSRARPSTLKTKGNILRKHICPHLGQLRLSEITPGIIREWQNGFMQLGFSRSFAAAVHGVLSAVFNYACKFHGLGQNPCRLAGSMGRMKREVPYCFLTMEDFKRLRAAMLADRKEMLAAAVSFMFLTGCRVGEVLALTPADFDFSAAVVSITKSCSREHGKDVIRGTKTERGRRTITLPPALVSIMQGILTKLGNPAPGQRIFDTLSAQSIRLNLNAYTKKTGVPNVRTHDLRHSHAALLIDQGFSPLAVADRLGHESPKTTLEVYGHLYPNKRAEIADRLQDMLT